MWLFALHQCIENISYAWKITAGFKQMAAHSFDAIDHL
jgi:hypothetical protein